MLAVLFCMAMSVHAPASPPDSNDVERGREFWAFKPPLDPAVPVVKDSRWPKSPLDHFILAALEAKGIKPARSADKRTLIRRATFDLIGLPPTPSDVNAFLADDSPDAFAHVVDRLLVSPHYGERWGRHWLDVARYADSNGLDENVAHGNAWRYRDYVIASFNRDKPYDQFLLEQLAGDLLPDSDRPSSPSELPSPLGGERSGVRGGDTTRHERLIATGFLSLGPKVLAEVDEKKMEMDIVDEQIETVGRTFMGLTLGCARCHDHKFDPIRTEDYYGLAGIFKSTRTMENFTKVAKWNENSLATSEDLAVKTAHDQKVAAQKGAIQHLTSDENQKLATEVRRHAGDYLLATIELEPAVKSVKTIEARAAERKLNVAFLKQWQAYLASTKSEPNSIFRPWHALTDAVDGLSSPEPQVAALFGQFKPALLAELAKRYQSLFDEAAETSPQKEANKTESKTVPATPSPGIEAVLKVLADPKGPFALPKESEPFFPSETQAELKRLREELTKLEKSPPEMPSAMGMAEGSIVEARVHIRGSHLTLGDPVPRRFPAVFTGHQPAIDNNQSGRLQLAQWLIDKDHPLTSRVMINRIWRWHFGQGLVQSPDNFGKLGERPVNPPLLDWLARRFIEGGWSIKAMHRLIMLSSTYQMSHDNDPKAAELDSENRLHWRANVRRLEAEVIRDSLLAVSDTLDPTMGGSLLHVKNRDYFFDHTSKDATKYDSLRRSIYLPVVRNNLYDVFQLFDCPDASVMNGDRAISTVAPQALFMMNSDLVADATEHLATGLLAHPELDDTSRVRLLFAKAYGRPPSAHETAKALRFVESFDQALVTKEQAKETNAEKRRLHAWQSLCQVIVASNEFVYVK